LAGAHGDILNAHRVDIDHKILAHLGDRRRMRGQNRFAIGNAFANWQTPALVETDKGREETIAIQPVEIARPSLALSICDNSSLTSKKRPPKR
jgi:hypothetical protein